MATKPLLSKFSLESSSFQGMLTAPAGLASGQNGVPSTAPLWKRIRKECPRSLKGGGTPTHPPN